MNDNVYLQIRKLIALIEDGDKIAISVSKGTLELLVDSAVLESRRAKWKPVKKEIPSKWLRRYVLLVSNATNGAECKNITLKHKHRFNIL